MEIRIPSHLAYRSRSSQALKGTQMKVQRPAKEGAKWQKREREKETKKMVIEMKAKSNAIF